MTRLKDQTENKVFYVSIAFSKKDTVIDKTSTQQDGVKTFTYLVSFPKFSDFIHLSHKIEAICVLVGKNGRFFRESTYYDIIILFFMLCGLKSCVIKERWGDR